MGLAAVPVDEVSTGVLSTAAADLPKPNCSWTLGRDGMFEAAKLARFVSELPALARGFLMSSIYMLIKLELMLPAAGMRFGVSGSLCVSVVALAF